MLKIDTGSLRGVSESRNQKRKRHHRHREQKEREEIDRQVGIGEESKLSRGARSEHKQYGQGLMICQKRGKEIYKEQV